MAEIQLERNADKGEMERRGVFDWPIWTHGEATFPWTYDADEECYILEGDVMVTPDGGEPVHVQAGDFVRFPAGMSCTWEIRKPIRKHYNFP